MRGYRCFYTAACVTTQLLLFQTATAEPPSFELFNVSSYQELVNISQSLTSDVSNPSSEKSQPLLADDFGGEPGFYHGVASGDPLSDAVIVWTRYTPVNVDDEVTLELRMAAVNDNGNAMPEESLLDPDVNPNLKRANIVVTAAHDWIAKIDVTNLPSNTEFVFSFIEGDHVSDVGTTRTAPALDESVEEMTYAVFSCAHFGNGYFHAYDVASTIKDLDFWVHVGDYLYEYSPDFSSYASDAEERKAKIMPRWETIELQDYRLRHHTYVALDEGLRNLRYALYIWIDIGDAYVCFVLGYHSLCRLAYLPATVAVLQ